MDFRCGCCDPLAAFPVLPRGPSGHLTPRGWYVIDRNLIAGNIRMEGCATFESGDGMANVSEMRCRVGSGSGVSGDGTLRIRRREPPLLTCKIVEAKE
jgi:hypothetical protein